MILSEQRVCWQRGPSHVEKNHARRMLTSSPLLTQPMDGTSVLTLFHQVAIRVLAVDRSAGAASGPIGNPQTPRTYIAPDGFMATLACSIR